MRKELRDMLVFPLETMRIKVGLDGIHYHLPDCPAASRDSFTIPESYDYVEVEVPKIWVEKEVDIPLFGRVYISHIKACKEMLRRLQLKEKKRRAQCKTKIP